MKRLALIMLSSLAILIVKAQDTGLATYYGRKFNNKKTASGEMYRKDSLVCAHRTYPFGTLLRVRSMKDNREVIVRVIDRGPRAKKRIIDLSYAAAKELRMVNHGVIPVEVSVFTDPLSIVNQIDTINIQEIKGR
ncbi:MAG: septal ring lytic transglycosylase RlpA family protein [Prevotella sp.]|jgi:rare lipoprotein A|nr:septal ring lytic transglycosylase RlpA family protein [Prevotella sp.]